MATCGNPFLNQRAFGGLRRWACAALWLLDFHCFSFVLQYFSYISFLSFVFFRMVFLGLRRYLRPIYIYIYGVSHRSAPRPAPRFCFVHFLHFLFVSCFLYAIHASAHASKPLFSLNKMHTSHLRLPRLVCTSHSYCFLVGDFLYISLWSPLYFPYISKP